MKRVVYYDTQILIHADSHKLYRHQNGWYTVDSVLNIRDVIGWAADQRNVWNTLTLGTPDWDSTLNICSGEFYSLEAVGDDGQRHVYSGVYFVGDDSYYPTNITGECKAWKDFSHIASAIWNHDEFYRGSKWVFIVTSASNDLVLEIHCDYKQ